VVVVGHHLRLWVLVGGNGGQCSFVGCGRLCVFGVGGWGGNGGSSSPMLGVVMGHRLGGWWWALIAIHIDTLPLCSIMVVVVVACHCCPSIHPSLSCCIGSKSDNK